MHTHAYACAYAHETRTCTHAHETRTCTHAHETRTHAYTHAYKHAHETRTYAYAWMRRPLRDSTRRRPRPQGALVKQARMQRLEGAAA